MYNVPSPFPTSYIRKMIYEYLTNGYNFHNLILSSVPFQIYQISKLLHFQHSLQPLSTISNTLFSFSFLPRIHHFLFSFIHRKKWFITIFLLQPFSPFLLELPLFFIDGVFFLYWFPLFIHTSILIFLPSSATCFPLHTPWSKYFVVRLWWCFILSIYLFSPIVSHLRNLMVLDWWFRSFFIYGFIMDCSLLFIFIFARFMAWFRPLSLIIFYLFWLMVFGCYLFFHALCVSIIFLCILCSLNLFIIDCDLLFIVFHIWFLSFSLCLPRFMIFYFIIHSVFISDLYLTC